MKEQLKKYGKVSFDVSLERYTSYHLKEKAAYFIVVDKIESLKALLVYLKNNDIKYKIIGGGTNLIFENFYDGVLIYLDFKKCKIKNNEVVVGSGYSTIALSNKVSHMGLTGMEFSSGIPGTIGGAVVNNSGAYKSDMGYIVKKVKVLTPNLEIKELYNKDLDFHYRTSFLKKNPGYVILEVTINLKKGDKKEILEIINDRKKRRLESQPLEFPSAGSVFRNPKDLFAGKLIEDLNLKGYQIGGAQVSEKHANFIINVGNATGKDIVGLINYIKEKVKEKYQIDLVLEQEIVK
jgi:UDP-N-acetylmuramate dehydrogenase